MINIRNKKGQFKKGYSKEQSFVWKGGRIKTSHGYWRIYKPEHPRSIRKYVLEHIVVMESSIGRHLKDGEVIHHINGKRDDNRIENLVLCKSTKEHHAHHLGRTAWNKGKKETREEVLRKMSLSHRKND